MSDHVWTDEEVYAVTEIAKLQAEVVRLRAALSEARAENAPSVIGELRGAEELSRRFFAVTLHLKWPTPDIEWRMGHSYRIAPVQSTAALRGPSETENGLPKVCPNCGVEIVYTTRDGPFPTLLTRCQSCGRDVRGPSERGTET